MLIPIQSQTNGCPEYAMVELQGSLEIQEAAKERMLGLKIGDVTSTTDGLTLLIGYHELHGKETILKSPLVLLKKQTTPEDVCGPSHSQQQSGDVGDGGKDSLRYLVEGVIRRKYIFKSRPKALISKQEMKSKKTKSSGELVFEVVGTDPSTHAKDSRQSICVNPGG